MYTILYYTILYELQILLVTSSSHTDQWIVPGGGIEPDETSDVAALREVIEEAGVNGNIDRFLGIFQVPNKAKLLC